MHTRPALPLLAAALAALTLLPAACRIGGEKPDGSGTIECTEVRIAAEIPGRLVSLPPHEGDAVKKGDVVARLDDAGHQLRRAEAQAALAQAEAQRDLMKAGSREEDIQRARQQLAEAEAAARAAAADRQRVLAVFEQGSATRKQLDDAVALAERTTAAQGAAAQVLERATRGNRVEEIRIAEAQVAQAQARLAQIDKAIADCTIAAPLDGVVTAREREEGEVVAAGAPLLTVSRLDDPWLSVYVPEDRLAHLKLGQTARVKVDGDAALHEGKVTFIAQEAEFTPRNVQTAEERTKLVYRVKIALPNADRRLKPGMPADGYLSTTADSR